MSARGATLRIAWREVRRNKLRTALTLVLIGLPIALLLAFDIVVRSGMPTRQENVNETLAGAEALVYAPVGATKVEQPTTAAEASGFTYSEQAEQGTGLPALRPEQQVLSLLPTGSQLAALEVADKIPAGTHDENMRLLDVEMLDIRLAGAGNRYVLTAGSAPTDNDEVAITDKLAADLNIGAGATIRVGIPARDFRVSGLVKRSFSASDRAIVVGLPGSISIADRQQMPRYLLSGPPISWSQIQQLNTHGLFVYSRTATLDPNAPHYNMAMETYDDALPFAFGALVVALGIIQVVFLAGPAFAITARQLHRELAIMTTTGAEPRHIRAVMLLSGFVKGLMGSLAGLLVGVGISFGGIWLIQHLEAYPIHGMHISKWSLLILGMTGTITSVLAALPSAISAARADAVKSLGRSPSPTQRAGWLSAIGAILFAAGVGCVMYVGLSPLPEFGKAGTRELDLAAHSAMSTHMTVLVLGLCLLLIGLVLASPLVLIGLGKLCNGLPTVPRLAVRDAARNRARSAPAVAAITAVTGFTVFYSVLFTTYGVDQAHSYQRYMPEGQMVISGWYEPWGAQRHQISQTQIDRVIERVEKQWPQARYAKLNAIWSAAGSRHFELMPVEAKQCPWRQPRERDLRGFSSGSSSNIVDGPPPASQLAAARVDPRCAGMIYSVLPPKPAGVFPLGRITWDSMLVADPDSLTRLLPPSAQPAIDALRKGRAVVLNPEMLSDDGTVTILLEGPETNGNPKGQTPPAGDGEKIITIPAVAGPWEYTGLAAILPMNVLPDAQYSAMLVVDGAGISDIPQSKHLSALLASWGTSAEVSVDPGEPLNKMPAIWVFVAAAALFIGLTVTVVTALGISDARADLSTLHAVGAPAWTRRFLSGWSAALVTAVGCFFGSVLGLVTAWGALRLEYKSGDLASARYVVPWPELVVLGVALPMLAFAVAALITRSKTPMVQRIT